MFSAPRVRVKTLPSTAICRLLLWQVEAEIETFGAVDDVVVTRSANNSESDRNFNQYTVTFTGAAVAGDVPQLRVIDFGENGCGGRSNATVGHTSEKTLAESFVPLYKVQNTADLAYNATAADMKAAIESLSGACTVDVSRSIREYGYEWLVTFSDSKADRLLWPMRPNAILLDNVAGGFDTEAVVVPILRFDLTAPMSGVPYYVRAAAINEVGVGDFRLSTPASLQPAQQAPAAPRRATARALSDSDILIQWEPPLSDGGEYVSGYVLEWDTAPMFDSGEDGNSIGSANVEVSDQSSVADVQAVRVSIDDEMYVSGSFVLKYNGQATGNIPFDASAVDVETALESLCTVGDVAVTRTLGPANGGHTWMVTIVTEKGWGETGDGQVTTTSVLQTVASHKLSVAGENLLTCADEARSSCWSDSDQTSIAVETQREIQRLLCNPNVEFTIMFMGEKTGSLSNRASATEIEKALEVLYTIGDVTVIGACGKQTDSFIYVIFENDAGDLPPLFSSAEGLFEEVKKGNKQVVTGRKPFSYTINNIVAATPWYIRISAYNRIGYSDFAVVTHDYDEVIVGGVAAPSLPQNIAVEIASARSAWVYWDAPSLNGGDEIIKYIIEVDTQDGFDSTCADGPELQTFTVSANDSNHAGETFNLTIADKQYLKCLDWNTSDSGFPVQNALRSRGGVLSNVVVTRGGDASAVWDYGYTFSVTFVHNASDRALADIQQMEIVSCGTGTDKVNYVVKTLREGTSSETSACQAENLRPIRSDSVLASEAKRRGHSVVGEFGYLFAGLTPGTEYRARVAAVNSIARSPWRFTGYPGRPLSFTPVGVPNATRNVTVSPGSKASELHVGLGLPVGIDVNGVGGLPLLGFRVEISRRVDEVQAVSVSFAPDESGLGIAYPTEGSYTLTVNNATTWCLDWNASEEKVGLALDSLVTVDGVEVKSLLPEINSTTTGTTSLYSSRLLLVSFTGPRLSNGDQELMTLGICTQMNKGAYLDVYTVTDGVAGGKSPVITVSTSATNGAMISGFYVISFGYRAELNLRLGEGGWSNETSVYVSVDAGSKTIRCSSDLSHYINPGDLVKIGEVNLVVAGTFTCEDKVAWENSGAEYPCTFAVESPHPTGAFAVPAYGASNAVGSAHVSSGSKKVLTDWDLTHYLIAGDIIVIRDPISQKYHQCVIASVTSIDITLEEGYPGLSSPRAAVFFRPFVVVPFDSSAEELRDAVESLPGVGSVDVTREGPDKYHAFKWEVKLTSFNGPLSGEYNLHVSSTTVKALEVTSCGEARNGVYVATGKILNGRMYYKLMDRSSYIQYDPWADNGLGLWVVTGNNLNEPYTTAVIRRGGAARDTMVPPTEVSSNSNVGCVVSLPTSPVALLDGSISSAVTEPGVKADFSSLVKDLTTTPGLPEVQAIELGATSHALDGTFLVDFSNTGGFTAAWDTTAADMEVRSYVCDLSGSWRYYVTAPTETWSDLYECSGGNDMTNNPKCPSHILHITPVFLY